LRLLGTRGLGLALCVALCAARPAAAQPESAAVAPCSDANLLANKAPKDEQELHGASALITDGQVARDGTGWDAPMAVTLDGQGSVTYDLGEAQEVRAVFLQADANDEYTVSGSLDLEPSSFTKLTVIDNVSSQDGPGLRSRAVEIELARVRYVRVGQGRGDGYYSISEFALYCRKPSPFPAVMRVVEAPGPERETKPDMRAGVPDAWRNGLLGTAALLALLGLVAWIAARARRSKAEPSAAESARPGPRDPAHPRLLLVFVASGCAALIYEVVWFHLLRLVIGASALSVGLVLASFMGGMFLGSLLFPRLVGPWHSPLRVYALLELGVGVFGLAMPLLLPAVRHVYVGLVGYGALGIALRALIAAVLLLPPTALMGATLPAIARRYAPGRRGMSGLSALYAANTFGAVLGCLLSGFYLLAQWDVWVATFAAVALNFAVAGYALLLARGAQAGTAKAKVPLPLPSPQSLATTADERAVFLATALSGLTALGAQVVWTRLLTLLFGATVYAFSIILAVFLGGMGIGSALASFLLRRGVPAMRGLAVAQLALVPTLLLAGAVLVGVLPYSSPSAGVSVDVLHSLHVLRAIDVILPSAILWGMSFPFALAAASTRARDTGRSSGLVYASNTAGAILGALAVSFFAIPKLGTQWASQLLVLFAALSAALLFFALARSRREPAGVPWLRGLPAPLFALAIGACAAALVPGLSTVFLAHGRNIWWVDPGDRYPYVAEGAASTVAVHVAPNGFRNFHVSGRVEASNNPDDLRLERLLGHLSALVHPRPETVLVVGLGGGVTAGALTLHPEVKRIVICEIEPRVVGAANEFAKENYAVLSDPRVTLVFDDARHFLATTDERFDVITSDPIHPWVRGNSVLFSREYYAIVKDRLKPGGIATQWVPLYDTNEEAIKIQMRTFIDAFPQGTVWNSAVGGRGYDVVLLGSVEPLRIDVAAIERRMAQPRIRQSLREVKIGTALDLLATYGTSGPDMQRWFAGTPVNRDFSLKLEYISGLAINQQRADPIYAHMTRDRTFPAEMFDADPERVKALRRRIRAQR
jgi:spermidine synthase